MSNKTMLATLALGDVLPARLRRQDEGDAGRQGRSAAQHQRRKGTAELD